MRKFQFFVMIMLLTVTLGKGGGGCSGCGGGGDGRPVSHFQIMGHVYGFDGAVDLAKIELWTIDGAALLASTNVSADVATMLVALDNASADVKSFSFPEDKKLRGRFLLSADVPGFGRVMDVVDTTEPTNKSITPLSMLVLESAAGDYSEAGIEKAQKIVAKFIGIPKLDDYSPHSLNVIIPLSDDIEEFDPTGFSYQKFNTDLASENLSFNKAISGWAEKAKRGEQHRPSLVLGDGPAKVNIFTYILKLAGKGAVSYVGGEAAGWILKLISDGGEHKEVMDALKDMSRKLDEIQKNLDRFESDMKKILAELKLDVAYAAIKHNVDDVWTAYNRHLVEGIVRDKSKDKERLKQKINKFVSDYETKLDRDIHSIHTGLANNPVGGSGIYKLMAENSLASIRNGSMSLEGAVKRYVVAYTFFVGIQMEGLLCKIEILNKTIPNNETRRIEVLQEIDRFKARIAEQSANFMNHAELLITGTTQNAAATFDYHDNDYMPKNQDISVNPYYLTDSITADSRGLEAQVVFRVLFDPNAPDKPWSRGWGNGEGWWNDVYIRDYGNYFKNTGVKAMMQKLADNPSGKHLPVYLSKTSGGGNIKAVNGEFGSVQTFKWEEIDKGTPIGKTATVLRWVFAGDGVVSSDTYRIVFDNRLDNFNIRSGIYRHGTIGTRLIRTEPIQVNTVPLKIRMDPKDSNCSITTFAWLPDNFLLPDPLTTRMELAMKTLSRMGQNVPAYVGWERETTFTGTYHMMTCDWENPLWHTATRDDGYVYFRESRIIYKAIVNRETRGMHIYPIDGNRISYEQKDNPIFFVQPPSIMSMFLDEKSYSPNAREPITVKTGYPLFIGMTQEGKRGYWHWNNKGSKIRVSCPLDGGTNYDAYWVLEKR